MSITVIERNINGRKVNIAVRSTPVGDYEATCDGFKTVASGRTSGRAVRNLLRAL